MGFVKSLQGERIYLDTNIWVYAIEGYPEYANLLTELFRFLEQGKYEVLTSELSLAEALVRPLRDDNIDLQQIYKEALTNSDILSVIPVKRSILVQAAQLRAQTSLKLPDALHAATALSTRSTTFLTNDKQLRKIPGIEVVLLSELSTEAP